MMLTFVSLALAMGSVMAAPLPQGADADPTVVIDPMPTAPVCAHTYISVAGDSCASIGTAYQLSATQIHEANVFLNCDDIWTWTPVCIPEGGVAPTSTPPTTPSGCASTYTSVAGDTCASIAAQNTGLTATDILTANTFLDCANIWAYTPVCIPTPSGTTPTPPSACASTYTSEAHDTCESIETKFGLVAGAVKAANSYVTCDDIWVYTPICLPAGPTYTATLPTATVGPTATEVESESSTETESASVPAPTDPVTIPEVEPVDPVTA